MSTETYTTPTRDESAPPFRYTAALAAEIEARWQDRWDAEGTFHAPNPTGPLAPTDGSPVPAGQAVPAGHVPLPVGQGTARRAPAGLHRHRRDGPVHADDRPQRAAHHRLRLLRPARRAVRHPHRHPPAHHHRGRTSPGTGRSCGGWASRHDQRRSVATTDPEFFRWTQWIFTQLFEAWYDDRRRGARPIAALVDEFDAGDRPTPDGRPWAELTHVEQAPVLAGYRLAYIDEAPVNWCPGLGTVLSNEEVTADGSQRDRQLPGLPAQPAAVDDADHRLRRPAAGRPGPAGLAGVGQGHAAQLDRPLVRRPGAASRCSTADGADRTSIEVYTTRPDTLFGATYMVLAPEHPLVERSSRPSPGRTGPTRAGPAGAATPAEAVAAYRREASTQVRPGPAGEQGEDRRLHRRVRGQPGQRRRDCRSSSPTTC